MSFFETTPLGRIMNRFAKDIDTIDNTVSDSMRMFLMTAANVIGAFVLIAVIIPWFLVAVGAIMVLYYFLSLYYRASARELKRLDAILRSSLYAHFSESLTGLATHLSLTHLRITWRSDLETGGHATRHQCGAELETSRG